MINLGKIQIRSNQEFYVVLMSHRSGLTAAILLLITVSLVAVGLSATVTPVYAQATCYQSYSGLYPYYYPSYYGWYYPYSYGWYGNWYGIYGNYNYPYSSCVQLSVISNPANIGAQLTGGGAYYQGSTATFSVSQATIQVSPDTRYAFTQWSGDYSGVGTSGSITMNGAKTVTAVYQLQYHLSVSVQPSTIPAPSGEGWYNANDTANLSAPAPIIPVNTGTQFAFNGWQVDGGSPQSGELSVKMNAPHSVTAQYQLQYYLKITTNQGVPSGEGWYNAGSYANVTVSNPVSSSYGVSINFNGWQGDIQSSTQSTSILMDRPKTIAATWTTDSTVLNLTILCGIIAAFAVGIFLGFLIVKRKQASNLSARLPTVPRSLRRSKPPRTAKDEEKTEDQEKIKNQEKTREPPA